MVLPQLVCAADGYGSSGFYPALGSSDNGDVFYPDLGSPDIEHQSLEFQHPVKLNPVTFDLSNASLQFVQDTSRFAGLTGCAVGAAGGGYVASRFNDLSPLAKITIVAGSAGVTGGMAYLLAKLHALSNTHEKRAEAAINQSVEQSNCAFDAHQRVFMSAVQRKELKGLINKDAQNASHRVAVYRFALDMRAQENSSTKRQCRLPDYPVLTATCYLDCKAQQLIAERDAANDMHSNWLGFQLSDVQSQQKEAMADSIKDNKQKLLAFTPILSGEELLGWSEKIKLLPEFLAEDGSSNLDAEFEKLQQFECQIKGELARLAALYGYHFSQAMLRENRVGSVCKKLNKKYPNTPEGQREKERDIQNTKNTLNRLIQSYLKVVRDYNAKVISCANSGVNTPEIIRKFSAQYSGQQMSFDPYPTNKILLQYNTYLNHNGGDLLWKWIQSFFE